MCTYTKNNNELWASIIEKAVSYNYFHFNKNKFFIDL